MPRKARSSKQSTVKQAMHKFKRGSLNSGRRTKRVTNRKQAIAIGLSEARQKGKGKRVPARRSASKRRSTAARRRTSSTSRARA